MQPLVAYGNDENVYQVSRTRDILEDVTKRRESATDRWIEALRSEGEEIESQREAVNIKKFDTAGKESWNKLNPTMHKWLNEAKKR